MHRSRRAGGFFYNISKIKIPDVAKKRCPLQTNGGA